MQEISKSGKEWMDKRRRNKTLPLKLVPTLDLTVKESAAAGSGSGGKQNEQAKTILPQTPGVDALPAQVLAKLRLGPYLPDEDAAAGKKQVKRGGGCQATDEETTRLYKLLVELRNDLAQDMELPPHLVANNKDLLELARTRPSTKDMMLKVDGMSIVKMKRIATPMLSVIDSFCAETTTSRDLFDDDDFATSSSSPRKSRDAGKRRRNDVSGEAGVEQRPISDTVRRTYKLFHDRGLSLEEISEERGLQLSSLGQHLADALQAGYPVSFHQLAITDDLIAKVVKAVRSPHINSDISRLVPIKEQLGEAVTWFQLKIIRAYLFKMYGMKVISGGGATKAPTTSASSKRASSGGGERKTPQQQRAVSASRPGPGLLKSATSGGSSGGAVKAGGRYSNRDRPFMQSTPTPPPPTTAVRKKTATPAFSTAGKRKSPAWGSNDGSSEKKKKFQFKKKPSSFQF